jgi:TRAP-type uncharacterized transport system fused permease subunit
VGALVGGAFGHVVHQLWPDVTATYPAYAAVGMAAIAAGLEGFMETRLRLLPRVLTFGCAVALLWPAPWYVHVAGLAGLASVFIPNFRRSRRPAGGTPAAT